jgi:DNA-binding PadR family transcriptional regulator
VIYIIYRLAIERGLIDLDHRTPLTEALFYILLATRRPNHGYGIIQDVNDMTEGRVTLGAGTLYGAINSLLAKGWLCLYSEDKESRKKKEYLITEVGKEVFWSEVNRLKELLDNAKRMED